MRSLWQLEALAYWLERPKPDKGRWAPVLGLMALTFAAEAIVALYIGGAFRAI